MKLEYVPNGSEDCPLIRLFDFDEEECEQLRLLLSQLAAGKLNQAALHEAEFIEPVDSCKITLLLADHDHGIVETAHRTFACRRSDEALLEMVDKAEPLCGPESDGYQWLIDDSDIRLLLSRSGHW